VLLAFITLKTPFAWNQEVAWDKWAQYFKVVAASLLIATVIYSPSRVRWLLWTILFSIGVFFGARGGLFAIASGGQSHVQGPEPSFIGGNTHLGVALLMVAPMFIAFVRDTSSRWMRWGAIVGFWLTMLATLFTYSRGAWLGMAVVALLMFLESKRKALVLAFVIPVAMVGVGLIPEKLFNRVDTIAQYKEDLSAMQRLQGWGVATNVALQHPLGAGFTLDATPVDIWMTYANFQRPEFRRANAAHSIYFQMLGDHGFGGLALFLLVVFGTLWTLMRVRAVARSDPERAWLGHYATALIIGLAGYCVAGAFVSLAYFDLFYTFVILTGILYREARATESQEIVTRIPVSTEPVAVRADSGGVSA
jgi:probable O-glycosylation ligase (exosortase A-associated)